MKLTAELGREELNRGPFPGKYLLTSARKPRGLVHGAAKGKSSRVLQRARSHLHALVFTWGIAGAAGWIHVWVVGWGSGGIACRITCNETKKKKKEKLRFCQRGERRGQHLWKAINNLCEQRGRRHSREVKHRCILCWPGYRKNYKCALQTYTRHHQYFIFIPLENEGDNRNAERRNVQCAPQKTTEKTHAR